VCVCVCVCYSKPLNFNTIIKTWKSTWFKVDTILNLETHTSTFPIASVFTNYTITFDFNTKIRWHHSSSFRYSNYINIVIQNLCCEHINSMTFVVVCICLRLIPKNMPSVLWRCWLDGRKGIRPVKTEWWGAGVVICLEQGVDLHMAQLMPLPLAVPCFSKIQTGFAFLVPAHPGSPRQRAFKQVCVLYQKTAVYNSV